MEEKGLIMRKKNPIDGRGVIIHLTKLGKEKRDLSRDTVLKFNEMVKQHISQEKLDSFIEVAETINELIADKLIFTDDTKETTNNK
jgi:DNA-binding MarR family transcriptional regulator